MGRSLQPSAPVAGWQTLIDEDLTVLAGRDWKANNDSSWTIGGVSWSLSNLTDAVQAQIVNGTGIVLEATGTTPNPMLSVLLSSLIPSYRWGIDDLMVYAWSVSSGLTTSGNQELFGLRDGANYSFYMGHYNSGGTLQWLSTSDLEDGTSGCDTGGNTGDQTLLFVAKDPLTLMTYSGAAWSNGWPAQSAMHHRGTVSPLGAPPNPLAKDPDPGSVSLFFMPLGANVTMTVKRLRVDIRK